MFAVIARSEREPLLQELLKVALNVVIITSDGAQRFFSIVFESSVPIIHKDVVRFASKLLVTYYEMLAF